MKVFLNVFCYIHSRSGSSLFGLKLFMLHIYEDMSSLHTFAYSGSRAGKGLVICYSLTSSLLFGVQYISTQLVVSLDKVSVILPIWGHNSDSLECMNTYKTVVKTMPTESESSNILECVGGVAMTT